MSKFEIYRTLGLVLVFAGGFLIAGGNFYPWNIALMGVGSGFIGFAYNLRDR